MTATLNPRLDVRASAADRTAVELSGIGKVFGRGTYLKHGSDFNSTPGVVAAIFLILLVGVGIELLVFRPVERRVLRVRGLGAAT